jgi:hypothetical protein
MTNAKNGSTNETPISGSQRAPGCAGSTIAADPTAREIAVQEAWAARHALIPATLSNMVGQASLGIRGARLYLESVVAEAGKPSDPVERIVLEQMVMAHHRLSLLNTMTLGAKTPEMVTAYNTAATRLLGEIRRLALSIRQYRLPPGQRSFSVVHQQNLVAQGEQTVQYIDVGQGQATMTARDEPNGKPTEAIGGRISGDNTDGHGEEPATSGSRDDQRLEKTPVE